MKEKNILAITICLFLIYLKIVPPMEKVTSTLASGGKEADAIKSDIRKSRISPRSTGSYGCKTVERGEQAEVFCEVINHLLGQKKIKELPPPEPSPTLTAF